jgi:hypothetical protein
MIIIIIRKNTHTHNLFSCQNESLRETVT